MKEFRVYVVDMDVIETVDMFITDEIFMNLAQKTGRVYTLKQFQSLFNDEFIDSSTDLIRIIEVEV